MTASPSVSAIVPAYNEERNIAKVLETLTASARINEVICVNDGSTDNTKSEIEKYRGQINFIDLEKNHGKAFAVLTGIEAAAGDIILLIDADLSGLTDYSIEALTEPILSGNYDAVVGFPTHRKFVDKIFKPLGGERSYHKKDILPYLKDFTKKGYGIELYLNDRFSQKRVKPVPLTEIYQPLKTEKQDFGTVLRMTTIQTFQLIRELFRNGNPVTFFHRAYLKHFYL